MAAGDNVKTWEQAKTWYFLERTNAEKVNSYKHTAPSEGIKNALKKMIELSSSESEANFSRDKARLHEHLESEAYDKVCEIKNKPGIIEKAKSWF